MGSQPSITFAPGKPTKESTRGGRFFPGEYSLLPRHFGLRRPDQLRRAPSLLISTKGLIGPKTPGFGENVCRWRNCAMNAACPETAYTHAVYALLVRFSLTPRIIRGYIPSSRRWRRWEARASDSC
jgi:hypothetical protein